MFGFADQDKITYGLGYTLTLKRNSSSNDATIRGNGLDAAKVVAKDISWYIPDYVSNRNKFDSQTHDIAIFDRLSISYAVCKIGSGKYPDDGRECDYVRDKYDQPYSEIENFY